MSGKKTHVLSAAERKQRQRASLRSSGLVKLEVWVPASSLIALQRAAKLMGTSMKDECAALLTHLTERHAQSAEVFSKKAASLWAKAEPLMPYSQFLQKPGAVFRVGEIELRSDDWLAIEPELLRIFTQLHGQRGWSSKRVEKFLRHAARQSQPPQNAPTRA